MIGGLRRPVRWLLAGIVVVVAVAIAVWPRGQDSAGTAAARPSATADLAAERARADLPACPAQPTGSQPPKDTNALAGARVTCLADGARVDLGALLAGAPALVNVWASWCQPCQQELPALDAYAATPGAIRVLGVQVQSDQLSGLRLLASLGVRHLPTVFDTGGDAARALRLPVGLPVSYLVRPDGTATVITRPSRVLDSVAQVRQAVTTYLRPGGGA
jgi:thiol-disulfide isomerase/thioredoxin